MATFGTFVSGQILTSAELNAGLPTCVLENISVSLVSGTGLAIPFTSEVTDLNGWHSTSVNTSRITPNIAGTYLVTMQINDVSVGLTRSLIQLLKNGAVTTIPIMTDTTGIFDDFNATGFVTANGTTDYFEMNALVQGANKTAKAQFTMTRISS
jgi:hypothetical protein